MGLFDRKEKIPELPPAPSLPLLPQLPRLDQKNSEEFMRLPELPTTNKKQRETREINELPMLPGGNNSMNQEMVKSAIMDLPEENAEDESEENMQLPQIEEETENSIKLPEIKEESRLKEKTEEEPRPVFIRIDKFQEAQKEFELMKRRLKEIDSVIIKMRSLMEKENEELKNWESDIEKMKSKFSLIDSTIFNKI